MIWVLSPKPPCLCVEIVAEAYQCKPWPDVREHDFFFFSVRFLCVDFPPASITPLPTRNRIYNRIPFLLLLYTPFGAREFTFSTSSAWQTILSTERLTWVGPMRFLQSVNDFFFRLKRKKLKCKIRVILIQIAFVCCARPCDSFYSVCRRRRRR